MSGQYTIVDKLRQRVKEQGQSPAFIFRTRDYGRCVLTWSTLYRLAGRFAALVNSRGLGRGQLVVSTLVNSPERVVCEAGLWMSGAASVNGHCQMADGSDLLNTIRVSRASALLVDPDVTNSPWTVLKKHVTLGENDSVTSSTLPDLKTIFFIRRVEGGGPEDFMTHLEAQKNCFEADDVTPKDILTVFTTSGTTGFSKLVAYTHSDMFSPMESFTEDEQYDEKLITNACIFSLAPLGWMGGYAGVGVVGRYTRVLCDVRAGGIPDDMPEFIWKVLKEEKCNSAAIPPAYLASLAQMAKARQQKSDSVDDAHTSEIHKLPFIGLGGQPVSRAMMEAAQCLAQVVFVGYGATDFSFVSALLVTEGETYVDHDTGPPRKGVSVKIVSPDDEDQVLPVNQVGNILVKGPSRNQGYIGKNTEDFITKDGFFRTQDMGRLDERGHLIVDGRGCDAIMRGSYIFYPSWMESRILACPGVLEVVVIGIPHPFLNEELCACVVLDSDLVTLNQVRQFVEREVLTSEDDPLSPRPRYYLEFESFPATDSGKPRRNVIKAQAMGRIPKPSKL